MKLSLVILSTLASCGVINTLKHMTKLDKYNPIIKAIEEQIPKMTDLQNIVTKVDFDFGNFKAITPESFAEINAIIDDIYSKVLSDEADKIGSQSEAYERLAEKVSLVSEIFEEPTIVGKTLSEEQLAIIQDALNYFHITKKELEGHNVKVYAVMGLVSILSILGVGFAFHAFGSKEKETETAAVAQ